MNRELSSAVVRGNTRRRISIFAAGAAFAFTGWACSSSDPGPSGPAAGAVGVAGSNVGGSATGGGGASATSAGAPAAGSSAAGATAAGGNASAGSGNSAGASAAAGAAGSPSGGSAGSAAGAAGAGGAAAGCVTAGSELCETFESGMLDAQRWKQAKPGTASIAVETGKAHSGQYAVHLKFVANQQSTVTISEGVTFPATPNKFYSRMWVNFGPDIPKATGMDFHTGFMIGEGMNNTGQVTVGMGMIGSDQQYLGYSIFFGNPKLEFGPWSNPSRIMANTWLCIELFEDGSDPTTEKRQVWLNDVEMKELASDSAKSSNGNANHLPPKFDKVTFGVIEYHPIPTLTDMWIDDIRVSKDKIGCAN